MRVVIVDQEPHRVIDHINDSIDGLDTTLRRSGGVDDQGGATSAGNRSAQPPERAHGSHGLGQAGRLTVDHRPGALGCEVAGPESGAAGCDHQAVKTGSEPPQGPGDRLGTVGRDRPLDNQPTGPCHVTFEDLPRSVFASAGDYAVGHREDLYAERIGCRFVVAVMIVGHGLTITVRNAAGDPAKMSDPCAIIEHMFASALSRTPPSVSRQSNPAAPNPDLSRFQEPASGRDAIRLVRELETLGRQVDAARSGLLAEIDRKGLHRDDGHASAKVMVRHAARLSSPEAARRARAARALRDLPTIKAAWQAGEIGTCQVHRLARAHANVRVRDALIDAEDWFLRKSTNRSYREFDLLITQWVSLADADGSRDTSEQSHHNRNAHIVQDFNKSWQLKAGCGPLNGAEMESILTKFVEAEFLTDWQEARELHGPDTTADHLARNASQRRFDALLEIFRRAASSLPHGGGAGVVTNVLIDQATFERALAELAGATPAMPLDPFSSTYRCSTIDGAPLDPTEVTAAALVGHVRRVVIGADGVVINMGRQQRLFTGSAQLAVRLSSTECYWPGCHVPTSQCQSDHLKAWSDPHRGPTDQANGGSACGRHNRHKQGGFSVFRDSAGGWHVLRPDGSEIE